MNERKTTNILLLVIALPVIFYVLKLLGFIFIPLVFSMFIALLFLPLMRWLTKKKVPKAVSLLVVIVIFGVFFKLFGEVVKLSSREIISSEADLFVKAESKVNALILPIENFFGASREEEKSLTVHYLQKADLGKEFGNTFTILKSTVSMLLMTAFFTILWLAESLNFQKLMNDTFLKRQFSSIRVFRKIEKDIITFIKVKFVISFFTGLGFTIACYSFGVSFPIFWGLFAFAINFVQMIGSIVSVVLLSIFALIEIDSTGTLAAFVMVITGVQAIMGGILEPIFMGKSFSINVITIIVMLMFWGFIWGVPGLILSIPITVFLKIVMEQNDKTKVIANLMSGKH